MSTTSRSSNWNTEVLQKVPIHKDDLFFIQAGTVHAIGAGALVAEIQENSNLKKSKQRSAKVQKNI